MPALETPTARAPLPITPHDTRGPCASAPWPNTEADPSGGSLRGLVWAVLFEGAGLGLAAGLLLLMGHWH